MENKIDKYSKILLATQTINFLAHNLNDINSNLIYINSKKEEPIITGMIERNEAQLDHMINTLKAMMNNIGDYLDGQDAVSSIDARITEEAFNIVVHGNDNVE